MKIRFLLTAACLLSPVALAINPPTPGPGPTDPPPDGPVACIDKTLRPGETTRTINVGGQRREYVLYVPRSYNNANKAPLLLDFHALMTSANYQISNSGTKQVADEEGFIVAYPQGINNAWNIGPCCTESRAVDDVGFARAVVEEVSAQACVDEQRVYATGYSNGGGMAYMLACRAADMFAAVAPAAFDMIAETACEPSRPVSVFAARGTRDSIVPFEGGKSTPPTRYRLDPITFLGAEGSFEKWADINHCSGTPANLGNNCKGYSNCDGDTEAVLCTATGGTHKAWEAEASWNFLKNHTLP